MDFAKEIQPILQQTCVKCHGPEKQKGKLRLDSKEAAFKGGKDGAVLTAGDAEKSELYRRIILPKGNDDVMPNEGEPLTKAQTDLIRDWINQLVGQGVLVQEEIVLPSGDRVPILKLNAGSWEVMKGQRTVRLMQCGLLLLFFGLEKRLGLSWRTHSMSIALGLGIYAGVDLSTTYLVDRLPALTVPFQIFTNLVYLGAASLWAYSLAKPEPVRSNVLDSPRRLIFQRWNEALLTHSVRGEMAFAGSGMESFLPGVEQTVERVLARKIVQ